MLQLFQMILQAKQNVKEIEQYVIVALFAKRKVKYLQMLPVDYFFFFLNNLK